MNSVVICDESPIFRLGLAQSLNAAGIKVAASVGMVNELLGLLPNRLFGLVIMDIQHDNGPSIGDVRFIVKAQSTLPVLVFTLAPEQNHGLKAVQCKAKGYLSKRVSDTELVRVVKKMMAGNSHYGQETMNRLTDGTQDLKGVELLSDRERQVAECLGRGETVSEIGRNLGLSAKTVSTYRQRILEKMGIPNNARLMRYMMESGLA